MGQAPTKPLSEKPYENLFDRPDISLLPDLSPLSRSQFISTPKVKSSTAICVETAPPYFPGGSTELKSRASRAARTVRQTHRKKTTAAYAKAPPALRRLSSQKSKGGTNAFSLASTKGDDSEGAGARREYATPPLPILHVDIPSINLVESSPLLAQRSGDGSISDPTRVAGSAIFKVSTVSPTIPPLPRGDSLPTMLAGSPLHLSRPVSPLQNPHDAFSRAATSPTLPLPGTPGPGELSVLTRGPQSMQPKLPYYTPVHSPSASSFSCEDNAHGHQSPDDHDHDSDHESFVTQEIRILRITNPDETMSIASEDEGPGIAFHESLTAPKTTLASKRQVPTPAPINVSAAFLPSPANTPRKEQSGRLLSPATPTSAGRLTYSSDPTSASTPITSVPPSPLDYKYNHADNKGLAVTVFSQGSDIWPDPFAQLDQLDDNLHPIISPLSPSLSPAVSRPLHHQQQRRSVSATPGQQLAKRPSVSSRGRGRSASHGSSDGDRSGEYSDASLLSCSSAAKRKGGKDRKKKDSARRKSEQLLHAEPTSARRSTRPRQSSPPALISLDFDVEGKETAAPISTSPTYAPPRSPRPSTGLFEGKSFGDDDLSETRPAFLLKPVAEVPPSIPLASPLIDTNAWSMTDFLLRCGIQPNANNSITMRNSSAPLPSPMLAPHPTILRPRSSASALSTDSPFLSTPVASPCPPIVEAAPLVRSSPGFLTPGWPSSPTKELSHRKRKEAEDALRYEAFRELAQTAVDTSNPFNDVAGAERLGEYKRGFDGMEIETWAIKVYRATKDKRREERTKRRAMKS